MGLFNIHNKSYNKQNFSSKEEEIKYRSRWSKIANNITLSRLITGPIVLIALAILLFNGVISAVVLSAFLACFLATDFIDGQIAKRHNACTIKGQRLDQIGDKVFNSTALICAMVTNFLPALAVLLGEVAILGVSTVKIKDNRASSIIGRFKMFPLAIFTILTFLGLSYPDIKENALLLNQSLLDLACKLTLLSQGATVASYVLPKKDKEVVVDNKELEELFIHDEELKQIKRNKEGYLGIKDTIKFGLNHLSTLGDIEFNDVAPKEENTLKLIMAVKKYENK